MALSEAAATAARVNLRNMVVLHKCARSTFLSWRGFQFQSYPSPISRAPKDAGSRNLRRVSRQFSERLFRCEKHHTGFEAPERDDFSSKRHPARSLLSMIFSENRYPLFRIMLM